MYWYQRGCRAFKLCCEGGKHERSRSTVINCVWIEFWLLHPRFSVQPNRASVLLDGKFWTETRLSGEFSYKLSTAVSFFS